MWLRLGFLQIINYKKEEKLNLRFLAIVFICIYNKYITQHTA